MLGTLFLFGVVLYLTKFYLDTVPKERTPPVAGYRLPYFGHVFHLFRDQIAGIQKLKEK